MIAPIPRATRLSAPSDRFSLCSPPSLSCRIRSSDLVAKRLTIDNLLSFARGSTLAPPAVRESARVRCTRVCSLTEELQSAPPQEYTGRAIPDSPLRGMAAPYPDESRAGGTAPQSSGYRTTELQR